MKRMSSQTPFPSIERIHLIAAFVLVGNHLSFAKAATEANISSSTLSRKVSRLEELFGVRLLERTTRQVVFTQIGRVFFNHCSEILARLTEADEMVASFNSEPKGVLRVSVPVAYGHLVLSNIMADFAKAFPKVTVEANCTDRFVDILEEGYDAVIRIGTLPDSSLIARKISSNEKQLLASPSYIAAHGAPETPSGLSHHNCLCFSRYERSGTIWQFKQGEHIEGIKVQGDFRSDDAETILNAAQQGSGVAILANYISADAIASGRLVPILPKWHIWPESNIYICYPSNKHLQPKTRAFSDFLTKRLRQKTEQPQREDMLNLELNPVSLTAH